MMTMETLPFDRFALVGFANGGGGAGLLQFVPILVFFAIFYFVLIAPMRKRQKALQQLIAALKKGDRVVTNGGLYGEVAAIEGSVVHLKVADNVRLRVAKSAISGLETTEEGGGK
jgi:preprotein translocase subunit YajC